MIGRLCCGEGHYGRGDWPALIVEFADKKNCPCSCCWAFAAVDSGAGLGQGSIGSGHGLGSA
jgi:hypothetical protein